jgi:quercetin dioxygenase-like cupin family protein
MVALAGPHGRRAFREAFMRPALASAFLIAALAGCAHAPAALPAASDAQTLNPWTRGVSFAPMGGAKDASAAFLTGSQAAAGLYTIRVRIAPGGSIAPHSHPDDRILTVVSGEVLYGFGPTADPTAAKLYRAGDVFVVPANAPHFAFAPEAEAIYQEAGMGPSGFIPVR